MNLKGKAHAYHRAVCEYDEQAVSQMVREDYIQHNPHVPTGRAPFIAFLSELKAHQTKIENVRMLQDGPYIIMHHKWTRAFPFGEKTMAAFHIIRFDDQGLIAEHWNVMREDTQDKSLTEGTTEITDKIKTEQNKNIVRRHVSQLVEGSSRDRHIGVALNYEKIHRIFGEGNFTLSICEGRKNGGPVAIYDLFRIEKNRVVEHWQIQQAIPKENLANENTMFRFPRKKRTQL